MINFSLREMAYLGIFGLSIIFAAVGSIPVLFAVITSPLFVLAFLKVYGEIPEMYIYYIILSLFEPKKKNKTKRRKRRKQVSSVSGFGERFMVNDDDDTAVSKSSATETIQRIPFTDEHTPIEMTLEIGSNHRYSTVTVLVDEQKILRDATNGAGQIKITIMPQEGKKRFSVRNQDGTMTIIAKTVELYHEK